MGYEILLRKPIDNPPHNRALADDVLKEFPEFSEYQRDLEAAAKDLAEDCGLTQEEYVSQHIGIELNCESEDSWIQIGFWTEYVIITMPNFPVRGCDEAINGMWRYIEYFLQRNFRVEDPISDGLIPIGQEKGKILMGYSERQGLVRKVEEIVKEDL